VNAGINMVIPLFFNDPRAKYQESVKNTCSDPKRRDCCEKDAKQMKLQCRSCNNFQIKWSIIHHNIKTAVSAQLLPVRLISGSVGG
jgi:hypothetical protein